MSLTSPLATIASLFDAAVSANGGNLPSDSDDWGVAAVFLPVLQSSSDKVPIRQLSLRVLSQPRSDYILCSSVSRRIPIFYIHFPVSMPRVLWIGSDFVQIKFRVW
jgi:hypothetical protein